VTYGAVARKFARLPWSIGLATPIMEALHGSGVDTD
jgi:hypothetical protein